MSYEPTNWVNNETPINADNLNKIEQQLVALGQQLVALKNATDATVCNPDTDVFSTEKTYSAGEYCIYNNILYKFTDEKSAGEWDDSVVESTTVVSELWNIKAVEISLLAEITTSLSDGNTGTATLSESFSNFQEIVLVCAGCFTSATSLWKTEDRFNTAFISTGDKYMLDLVRGGASNYLQAQADFTSGTQIDVYVKTSGYKLTNVKIYGIR